MLDRHDRWSQYPPTVDPTTATNPRGIVDGRFYPGFLCQLPGNADWPGPILAVEDKGADRWAAAADDRLIGGLWTNLSAGRCRFGMVRDKRWELIEEKLN